VTTTNGAQLLLRPIGPRDAAALVEFGEHLSPESVYRRFFSVHPRLSEPEVQRFTHVDYLDRLALVVSTGDRLVAVGRDDRRPGSDEAEVAFVVPTATDTARRQGITTFTAQAENREMLAVFANSGFHPTTRWSDPIKGQAPRGSPARNRTDAKLA
jgi:hypothetical protein